MIGSNSPSARQRETQLAFLERDHADVEREVEASRARSDLLERARWDYLLRRRGRDEGMAAHAAKTLAVLAIIRKVQQREEKQRNEMLRERDDLESRIERERDELDRQREEEERAREEERSSSRAAESGFGASGYRRGPDRPGEAGSLSSPDRPRGPRGPLRGATLRRPGRLSRPDRDRGDERGGDRGPDRD